MARRPRNASEDQLDLFASPAALPGKGAEPSGEVTSDEALLERRWEGFKDVVEHMPPHVRFGTSSWSFPGWSGIVYPRGRSQSDLARDGLSLYVRHPLLRTVGIDRSYYAPISEGDLRRYATQLPSGFPCCAKVPALFTTAVHLGHAGGERGAPNPHFLDAAGFLRMVAEPFLSAFLHHLGPMILEFPAVPTTYRLGPEEFAQRLDLFLAAMPSEIPFAVEVRDRRLITEEYRKVLERRRAAHTYNYWTAMPMPGEQVKLISPDTAAFAVVRLMLRPGTRYADRKRDFSPFDRIVQADASMRSQVVELVRLTEALGRNIFVLVNNKAEGSAPLTIEALAAACARIAGEEIA